jgi:hypothetical protein
MLSCAPGIVNETVRPSYDVMILINSVGVQQITHALFSDFFGLNYNWE